jgi:hypothetical protein
MHILIIIIITITTNLCAWCYIIFKVFYRQPDIKKNENKTNKYKEHKYPTNNIYTKYDVITFPHYKIYSSHINRNKIISYQLSEFLDIQPGICMSKEYIYSLIFKYIKKNMIFHKNKILIIPNIELLVDNKNTVITLNTLPEYIEPHIKNI